MHGAFELRVGRVCLKYLKYIITLSLQTRGLSVVSLKELFLDP